MSRGTGPTSPLDLWHPSAAPRRRLAVGRAAPTWNAPPADEAVDLAVVAPDGEQVSRTWLEQAISQAAARLARDGVLWVMVPRRWRRMAERILTACDLERLDDVLTVPSWPRTAHLVPVAPVALRYAASRHLQVPVALTPFVAALALMDPGRGALRLGARGCALVATRSSAAARLRWLGEIDGVVPITATATIGPRRDARVAVVMRFSKSGPRPDLAVKVALDERGADRLRRERAALEGVGPSARRAGAGVPLPRPTSMPWLLATGVLDGDPASALLSARRGRLARIASSVAAWLETWSVATASTVVAGHELLDRVLVDPARRVAEGGGAGMAEYLDVLGSLAARLEGRPVVLAAAHNDLTMSNVLVAGDRIGVVDWEGAVPAALPLLDLWYGLADALARACRLDRGRAVEALVHARSPVPSALAGLPARHARALSLSSEQAELSFHACWLHHAVNEVERGTAHGPFLNIVRCVAARRLLWPEPGGAGGP